MLVAEWLNSLTYLSFLIMMVMMGGCLTFKGKLNAYSGRGMLMQYECCFVLNRHAELYYKP